MASNMESSIHRGSDIFFDFSCFICQESDKNIEAEFYCEECSRFYCSKCVKHHNYLFKKHAILGKKNISQWPETNVGELEQCQEHRKEKLTGFCEDHSQLICHICHVHNHQKCSHVVLIADKVKDLHQTGDFKQLSATVDTQHQQLIQMKDDFEENMKSLEKSYKKTLEEINALRKKINDSLDQLEKNTKKELDSLLVTMRTSIRTDIENCTESIKNITCLKEDWQRKEKSEALSFIKYRKCLAHSLKVEAVLQQITTNNERTLTFNPDTTIQNTLSTLSGLGQIRKIAKQSQLAKRTTENTVPQQNKSTASSQYDAGNEKSDVTKSGQVFDPVSSSSQQLFLQGYQQREVSRTDQVIKVKSGKKYSVKIKGDKNKCVITGICETATGELLIADHINRKLKLLDQHYKVVAHLDMPGKTESMCSIDSSLVAVTAYTFEVHFIRVTNGQLIPDRRLKLKHKCWSIAHQHGSLYITDGYALYLYTVDGRLVSKMDKTIYFETVAVSPDGDRIYVTNRYNKHLVTLSRDGKVISTLIVSDLSPTGLPGLHVTDLGQVLVCRYLSETIIQVDREGRQILAKMVTRDDGVECPASVYYSKRTGSIIVGMGDKNTEQNDIIVFEAQ